jgi:hypothetical protein
VNRLPRSGFARTPGKGFPGSRDSSEWIVKPEANL